MTYVALTIAGSDPSGGAGIQADLKTFHQRGVYGESVITLLTVQNTRMVRDVKVLSAEFISSQLQAVLEDIPPQAAKTGALGDERVVVWLAAAASEFDFPLVIDPVMISKHGLPLMTESARKSVLEHLLPRAFLITPNLYEAGELAGFPVNDIPSMEAAAKRIGRLGPGAVLVKGGHLEGEAIDVLLYRGQISHFSAPRIDTPNTHGTGCTYSAAITAELAKGQDLADAVALAKRFVSLAIQTNPGLGKGSGPVNHHARIDE